jgi:hypothetical protein
MTSISAQLQTKKQVLLEAITHQDYQQIVNKLESYKLEDYDE